MKNKSVWVWGLIGVGLLVSLAACATRPTSVMEGASLPAQATAAPAAATAAPAEGALVPPVTPLPTAVAEGSDSAPGNTNQLAYAPANSNMVIKDAELNVLVRDTDVALDRVGQMATDYSGYIISLQTWYEDGFKYATVRLGLPSATFEKALNYMRGLGVQVISETASGQDVSAEYVDLQSKLANLEATTARVREFLQAATSVEESLRISQQLAELEGQIEQIKGQMRYYEGRAAFSTVTLHLTPEHPTPVPSATPTVTPTFTATPTPTPTPGWNPARTFSKASGVLEDMTQTTVDVAIWVAVVLGPIAILAGLIYLVGRRVLGRKR